MVKGFDFIFNSYNIPLIFFFIGVLLIVVTFLNLTSTRKVTLKKRAGKSNGNIFFKFLKSTIISYMQDKEFYNKLLDKGQFIYGYFSSASEKKNRIKAEEFIIRILGFNLLIVIAIMIYNLEFAAKLLIIFTIFILEYIYINSLIMKRKTKLKDEFHILVREFIESFVISKNVTLAFEESSSKLSAAYQIHVNRLVNQLNSASGYDDAFRIFDRRIDYSMCSCFISVVKSAFSTQKDVIQNLLELQQMLSDDRIEEKKNLNKLSVANNNIILWIVMCILGILIIGTIQATSSGNYFLTTLLGQKLLLVTIVFVLAGILAIKIADYI